MDIAQNIDTDLEHCGIYTALVNHQEKKLLLTWKRYRQPLMASSFEKMTNWVVKTLSEKYPDYELMIDAAECVT